MALIYQKDNFAAGLRFAVGESDFESLIESNACWVDKSLVMQDIIDSPDKIILFPRPRRFGKTLLMRMLKAFFEKSEKSKRHLFEPLQIWAAGEAYQAQQGQYPVIYLSFKDVKEPDFELAYQKMQGEIKNAYAAHHYLLESNELSAEDREIFSAILKETASRKSFENSLLNLSRWLEAHHQKPVVLLLDEYDTPVHAAFQYKYYDDFIPFIRSVMGAAFKDNRHLYRGIITGILRVSKESMFSDLNNLNVYSILHKKYGEYFGFTQTELDLILEKSNLQAHRAVIQTWYNGYRFGDLDIYNPWSIINCIREQGLLRPYWVNTADNSLVGDLFAKADANTKANLEKLLKHEPIEIMVREGIVFNTLNLGAESLYTFLLFTGYLKASNVQLASMGDKYTCIAEIPNEEIYRLYQTLFEEWMTSRLDLYNYQSLLNTLTTGDVEGFERLLKRYLEASISYFDAVTEPEKFYHGFILGILVGLQQTHEVRSNRESGLGRADILVIPKDPSKLGVVLEFKRSDSPEALPQGAENALAQIEKRAYVKELQSQGIKKVLAMGVAFHGKAIILKSEFY